MEWRIYNDIFVDREYDIPITETLARTGRITILNLGANVGFFDLRVMHLLKSMSFHEHVLIKSIEASKKLCEEYRKRCVVFNNDPHLEVQIFCGLIGQPNSEQTFFEFEDHGLNSIFRGDGLPVKITTINVEEVCRDVERINLLKCDIEGSEEVFLANYETVLRKTDAVVIEIHREFSNEDRCLAILRENGFAQQQSLHQYENGALYYMKR